MRKVISNTTPIIALAGIGRLELLHKLYGEVIIPRAVLEEIESEPAKSLVRSAGWIKVLSVPEETDRAVFSSRLHAGEIEVILLGRSQKADLVLMDDNAAKKTAKFLGLNVTGSLGVLIRSKKEGLIDSVKPLMDDLIQDGLYVSDDVQKMVLEAAGETSQ